MKQMLSQVEKSYQRKFTHRIRKNCEEVYEYAAQHLHDITRRSGESYFQHGCEVALTLQEISKDPSLISVAVLHDLLVHPHGRMLLKNSPINEEKRKLVQGMHSLRRLHIDEHTKDLDFLIKKFTHDGRLVLLRMAHRLNDIRHLSRFKPSLKQQIATETLHMYTAIAGRLSLHQWRREMEDTCFQVLHPKSFNRIKKLYESHRYIDEASMSHTQKFLQKHLQKRGLKTIIESRFKSYYSTYRKMILKSRTFDQLTDRLAVRIIVPDIQSCYIALGIVHQVMHPIPGKLKDYIGAPKENGYRSIHTVVYPLPGVTEQPIEVQIRTKEMHRECEYGVASHSNYKIWQNIFKRPEARVNIFRNLEHLQHEVRSPQQFEEALRTYFRSDHLMLFDHLNNLYYLKKPATLLDFAAMAYGKKCSRLKECWVNGKKEDLSTQLQNGDVVEIRFSRKSHFQKKWKTICLHKSSRALMDQLEKFTEKKAAK